MRSAARLVAAVLVTGALLGATPIDAVGATAADSITIDHDGEAVTVANGTSQVVGGTADFRVGTELSIRLRSTGDTQPRFLRTANAVVTEDGTWAVALDFSRQNAGDTFEVTVVPENGDASVSAEGEVVACEGDCADSPPRDTPTPLPEQTATRTPTQTAAAAVSLDDAVILTQQGSVATVEVDFGESDAATLRFGNESAVNYELVATVTDEDGDGRATLFFDTAQAGRDGQTLIASGEDSVTVLSETSLSTKLDPADYPIDVYAGSDAEGSPDSIGTLVVQSPDDSGTETGDSTGGEDSSDSGTDTEQPSGTAPDSSGVVGTLANNLGSVLLSGAFVVAGGGLAFLLMRE